MELPVLSSVEFLLLVISAVDLPICTLLFTAEVLRTRYMALRLVFLLVNLFHWKINQSTPMVMAYLTKKIHVSQSLVHLLHMVVLILMLMVLQIKLINVQLYPALLFIMDVQFQILMVMAWLTIKINA